MWSRMMRATPTLCGQFEIGSSTVVVRVLDGQRMFEHQVSLHCAVCFVCFALFVDNNSVDITFVIVMNNVNCLSIREFPELYTHT